MAHLKLDNRQSNRITESRHDYTLVERQIIYHIIANIQDKLGTGADETLFGDLLINIPMKELVGVGENYKRVKDSIIALRRKDFEFNDPEEQDLSGKNEHGFLAIGIINWGKYKRSTGNVEFEISKEIMPYLLKIAKGYTLFSLQVALKLKSVYSQRIYEFCCRFREHGKWNISIEDFKILLKIENEKSYSGRLANGNLKNRVFKVAEKEIKALYEKGECDLYFAYKFKKTGKFFTDIRVNIFSKFNPKHEPQKAESQQYVTNFFRDHFREDREKAFVKKAMNELFNKSAYNSFASKISGKLEKFYDSKIDKDDLKKLARHILKEDFQIQ